ncbi:MAG: COX15/CtaA family protein [Egibacteraceae bacterium]
MRYCSTSGLSNPYSAFSLAWTATAVAGLCFAQILVGGHVTGIGAGLVYPTFPLMDGALIPAIGTEREAFHVAHRLLAYLLAGGAAYLVVAALRHRRTMLAAGAWGHGQRWLLALPLATGLLVVVQIVLGVANLYNGTSFLTVIPHLAVASWIWATLVLHVLLAHGQAASRSAAAPTPSPTPRQEAPA